MLRGMWWSRIAKGDGTRDSDEYMAREGDVDAVLVVTMESGTSLLLGWMVE